MARSALIGEGLVLETNDEAHSREGEGVVLETNDEEHWEGEGVVLETNDEAHWEGEGVVLETNDEAHWEGEGVVLETNDELNLEDDKQVPDLTDTSERLRQQRRSLAAAQLPANTAPPHLTKRPCRASPRVLLHIRCALLTHTPVMKRYPSPARSNPGVCALVASSARLQRQLCAHALAPTDAALEEGADRCGGRRRRAVGRCESVAGAAHAIRICERNSCCTRDTQHSRLLGCSSQPPRQTPYPAKRSSSLTQLCLASQHP
jgi:hypothetical protein